MKWTWRTGVAAGGVLLAASLTTAQIPGGAPVGGTAAGVPGAAAGVPGAAPPAPMGFFGKCCAAAAACRAKLCASPAGAFLNNATLPLSTLTGGIVPPFCPVMPTAEDLAKPGVAGASDAIKKDALEAKMRREKVRFLGTVDCRYYPDAIGALTAALRMDASECVRYEAALALNRGCCCNQRTIDALTATVSGTDKDGNPAERSVRVRCVAAMALDRCLACYVPPPIETEIIEGGGKELKGGEIGTGGKKSIDAPPLLKLPEEMGSKNKGHSGENANANAGNRPPSRESVELARRTLNEFNALLAARTQPIASPPGERYSIYHIIKHSAGEPGSVVASSVIVETPVAQMQPTPMDQVQPKPMTGRPTLGQPTTAASLGPVAGPAPRTFGPDVMPSTPMPVAPKMPTGTPTSQGVGNTRPDSTTSASMMPITPPGSGMNSTVAPMISTAPQWSGMNSAVSVQLASPTPAVASSITPVVAQVINGSTPMERHTAIRKLVEFDWHKNPVVMSALVAGAKSDPAPAVRVDCLRHLATYQMAHPQVLTELGGLAHDNDPWVREEAAKALVQLKPTPTP